MSPRTTSPSTMAAMTPTMMVRTSASASSADPKPSIQAAPSSRATMAARWRAPPIPALPVSASTVGCSCPMTRASRDSWRPSPTPRAALRTSVSRSSATSAPTAIPSPWTPARATPCSMPATASSSLMIPPTATATSIRRCCIISKASMQVSRPRRRISRATTTASPSTSTLPQAKAARSCISQPSPTPWRKHRQRPRPSMRWTPRSSPDCRGQNFRRSRT